MLIACKYEEIHPPIGEDFVYITDNTYSKEQILSMECLILSTLNFEITFPTCQSLAHRFQNLANIANDAEACLFT